MPDRRSATTRLRNWGCGSQVRVLATPVLERGAQSSKRVVTPAGDRRLGSLQAQGRTTCDQCSTNEARDLLEALGMVWVGPEKMKATEKMKAATMYHSTCNAGHASIPRTLPRLRAMTRPPTCPQCERALIEAKALELGYSVVSQPDDGKAVYLLEWISCGHPAGRARKQSLLNRQGLTTCQTCRNEETLRLRLMQRRLLSVEEQRAEAQRHAERLGLRITGESLRGRNRAWETTRIACGHDGGTRALVSFQKTQVGRPCVQCQSDEAERHAERLGLRIVGEAARSGSSRAWNTVRACGHDVGSRTLNDLRRAKASPPCGQCRTDEAQRHAERLGWTIIGDGLVGHCRAWQMAFECCGHELGLRTMDSLRNATRPLCSQCQSVEVARLAERLGLRVVREGPRTRGPKGNRTWVTQFIACEHDGGTRRYDHLVHTQSASCRMCRREGILKLVESRPGVTFVRWVTEQSSVPIVSCRHGHERIIPHSNLRIHPTTAPCWCTSLRRRSNTLSQRFAEALADPELVLSDEDLGLLRMVLNHGR